MPRAFLITHRRYNGVEEEFDGSGRDFSPERGIRVTEYGGQHPTSDGASECGSETSSECPEELYNLTKLAEVSLAAAAGTLIHPSNVLYQRPVSPRCGQCPEKRSRLPGAAGGHRVDEEERTLGERTRLFFERIETEREILDRAEGNSVLGARLSPSYPEDETGSGVQEAIVRKESVQTIGRKGEAGKPEENEDHECPDCGKKYSTSSNLARHRQTHRSLGDKKARRCPHCDKVYVSMPAFSMHVRTHNQGCKCHYCGKCFSRPWLLQGHIRTHTGEKPFKCTICNKAFADKSNLRAHIQTHSNTKPHVCGRCGKAFALKSYLYKHEESSCMRSHRSATAPEKTETLEPKSAKPATTVPGSLNRLQSPCVTASPTSVIVPRLGPINRDQRTEGSAFSAIIKHTRSTDSAASTSPSTTKRPCTEDSNGVDRRRRSTDRGSEDPEYVSRMVIRTSVISPNPEHLNRFGNEAQNGGNFADYADPTRSSAFSRPTTMTLNLAIA